MQCALREEPLQACDGTRQGTGWRILLQSACLAEIHLSAPFLYSDGVARDTRLAAACHCSLRTMCGGSAQNQEVWLAELRCISQTGLCCHGPPTNMSVLMADSSADGLRAAGTTTSVWTGQGCSHDRGGDPLLGGAGRLRSECFLAGRAHALLEMHCNRLHLLSLCVHLTCACFDWIRTAMWTLIAMHSQLWLGLRSESLTGAGFGESICRQKAHATAIRAAIGS